MIDNVVISVILKSIYTLRLIKHIHDVGHNQRNIMYLTVTTCVLTYNSINGYVYFDYCSLVWAPYKKGDIEAVAGKDTESSHKKFVITQKIALQ